MNCSTCGARGTTGYLIRPGVVICRNCNRDHGGFAPGRTPLIWIPERR